MLVKRFEVCPKFIKKNLKSIYKAISLSMNNIFVNLRLQFLCKGFDHFIQHNLSKIHVANEIKVVIFNLHKQM